MSHRSYKIVNFVFAVMVAIAASVFSCLVVHAEVDDIPVSEWKPLELTITQDNIDDFEENVLTYTSSNSCYVHEVVLEFLDCSSNVTEARLSYLHGKWSNGQVWTVSPSKKIDKQLTESMKVWDNVASNDIGIFVTRTDSNSFYIKVRLTIGEAHILSNCNISLDKKVFTYAGKPCVPKPTITFQGTTLKEGTDYIYDVKFNKEPGLGYVYVYGKGNFFWDERIYKSSVNEDFVNFTIKKGTNPLAVGGKTAVVKASQLKKKVLTLPLSKILTFKSKGVGKRKYKIASVSKAKFKKYFKINASTGKLTIKKNLKKGTYTLKISVTAAGNKSYNARSKTAKVKIKVK